MGAKRRGAAGGRSGEKRGRREVAAELCAALGDAALREQAAAAWAGGEPLRHEAVAVEQVPFRHGVLRGLLASPAFAAALGDELLCLGFRERRNDLLSLRQSEELGARPEPHVSALRRALSGTLRVWLEAVTHIELEPSIDISCAKYESTDVLLCHDDELEGRRIAFILYLVPPWEKSDGGTLDLFSTDEHFQPQQIMKSLMPSWNTLVFFEVSPVSFHQMNLCQLIFATCTCQIFNRSGRKLNVISMTKQFNLCLSSQRQGVDFAGSIEQKVRLVFWRSTRDLSINICFSFLSMNRE
uniref:Prolyl 4-hydroxylase alpha subunit domain-containing protein n=1 Tax=Pavo cristatus TaxID=9049 RepID=A0A8C9F3F2_PAVCR